MNSTIKTAQAVRVPLYKGVRCVTRLKSSDPYATSINHFDVPDEDYTNGNLTGIHVAYEVMAAARKGDFDSFRAVFEAAANVLKESKKNPDRNIDGSGAAAGYLCTMSEILELAAQKLDLSNLMQDSFFSHEAMLQDTLDDVKSENAAFLASMNVGNAKKKSGAA